MSVRYEMIWWDKSNNAAATVNEILNKIQNKIEKTTQITENQTKNKKLLYK